MIIADEPVPDLNYATEDRATSWRGVLKSHEPTKIACGDVCGSNCLRHVAMIPSVSEAALLVNSRTLPDEVQSRVPSGPCPGEGLGPWGRLYESRIRARPRLEHLLVCQHGERAQPQHRYIP